VFDLGGVLVDVDFRRALRHWSRLARTSAEVLEARFRRDDAYCAHERGELDDRGYFAHLRATLGVGLPDEEILAGWNAVLGEPLPGIEPLARRLAKKFPLYVFSNTNPAHLAHFRPRYRALLSHFKEIFTSCELAARKPDEESFCRVAERIGVHPAEIAFFDDLEENVEGARRAGLQAFRVASPAEIDAISGSLARARTAS